MRARLDYYARHPHREQADLDLGGSGDALALHGRLKDVAFMDGGFLPCDPEEIRLRATVSVALWRSWPGRVEKKWPVEPDGSRRTNAELLAEMDRAKNRIAELAAAGRKGAAVRYGHGSAKAKPKPSHGSAMADRIGLDSIGLDSIGLELKGGETTEGASSSSTPSDSLKGTTEPEPATRFVLTLKTGEPWPIPKSAAAAYDDQEHGFGLAEIEAELLKLQKRTAADPSQRPTLEGAPGKVSSWLQKGPEIRDREKAKAPATPAGSHGYGDVLVGEPGSPERAAAMMAAKERP